MEESNFYKSFPSELWTYHILPILPVKTLLRFRCVCKLWRNTIDDPWFVIKHLKLSNNNVDKNQVISIEKLGHSLKGSRGLTVRNKNTLRKEADLFEQPDIYHFQVSINGLFFVKPTVIDMNVGVFSWENPLGMPYLKVWNPSIRKSLCLPPCPLGHDFDSHYNIKYLFGYRPLRNDYVMYAFRRDEYCDCRPINVSVAVYTLSDDLWNIRNDKLTLPPNWLFDGLDGNESVFCDGVLHWLGTDPGPYSYRTHLISFDFEVEKFSYLELPDASQASKTRNFRLLFILGESLAIFSISAKRSSIWVLKNNLWNLWFSGTKSSTGFNYINNNSYLFTSLFHVEDDGITLVFGDVCYKIMTDEIQKLDESLNLSGLILDTYMESLLLHKGCEGQIIESL